MCISMSKQYGESTLFDLVERTEVDDRRRMGWKVHHREESIDIPKQLPNTAVNYHVVQPHIVTYHIYGDVYVTYTQEGVSL